MAPCCQDSNRRNGPVCVLGVTCAAPESGTATQQCGRDSAQHGAAPEVPPHSCSVKPEMNTAGVGAGGNVQGRLQALNTLL